MSESRKRLIDEYVVHRLQMGDWDDDEEEMTDAQRRNHFRATAETLTDDQLVRACNSYAAAND